MFSAAVWFAQDYTWFAICIVVISVITIVITLVDNRRTLNDIKERTLYECKVNKFVRDESSGREHLQEVSSA